MRLFRPGTGKYRRYYNEYIKRAIFVKELVYYEKYSLEEAVRKLKANDSLEDILEKEKKMADARKAKGKA